jgi:PEP-CTERM motif
VKKIFSIAAVLAAFLFVSSGAAKADSGEQVVYTIAGPSSNPINAMFTMDVFPSVDPDNAVIGEGFTIDPVSITINGVDMAGDLVSFYNQNYLGGMSDQAGYFSLMNPGGATNFQFYTGSEATPQMTIFDGPVMQEDFISEDGKPYTVTVTTSAITTPEPASLMLLATGIVALCLMRKFQTA